MRRTTLLFLLVGCTGVISDGPADVPLEEPGEPRFDPDAPLPDFAPGAGVMHRLTQTQYRNVVEDVFGPLELTIALEEDEQTAEYTTHGAGQVTTSSRGVEQYRDAAMEIADQVLANADRFPALAGCTAPTAASDPCIAEVVRTFGRGLFRRDLESAEVELYAGIAGAAGTEADLVAMGMRYVLGALLQAPHFLYAPAIGEAAEDGMRRYTASEMASRLSLLFWDRGPDETLLEAVRAGRLESAEDVEREARRMLRDPLASDLAARFLAESWHVHGLRAVDKRTDRFAAWSPELLEDFRTEFELFLTDLTFERDGDLLEIFDGRETFANARLAELYGLSSEGTGFERTALDDARTGLLTSGAVIAANSPADRSTPTERGVFVLEKLLCRDLASPPQAALEAAQEALAGIEPGDERGFIEGRLADPACGGCHQTIDPLGMVFDEFNAIGEHRLGGDAIGSLGNEPYASVQELAAELRNDPEASWCMVRRLYDYAAGRTVGVGESRSIAEAGDRFSGGSNSFRELMVAIVTSDGFRFLEEDGE